MAKLTRLCAGTVSPLWRSSPASVSELCRPENAIGSRSTSQLPIPPRRYLPGNRAKMTCSKVCRLCVVTVTSVCRHTYQLATADAANWKFWPRGLRAGRTGQRILGERALPASVGGGGIVGWEGGIARWLGGRRASAGRGGRRAGTGVASGYCDGGERSVKLPRTVPRRAPIASRSDGVAASASASDVDP